MPKPMQEAVAAFVAEHHVEQVFVKRKRDRANPEALARRGRRQVKIANERSGKFPHALVAPQARGRRDGGRTGRPPDRRASRRRGEEAAQAGSRAQRPKRTRRPLPEFDLGEAAVARIRSARNPTSAPSCKPACRRRSRHAALRRAWVGRSGDPRLHWAGGERLGLHAIPRACRGSASSIRASTSRSLSPRFSVKARPEAKAQADLGVSTPAPEQPPQAPDKSNTSGGVAATSEPPAVEQQKLAALESAAMLQGEKDVATQQIDTADEPAATPTRRHGSAMPQ